MPSAHPFVVNGERVFLTYPQCPLERERIRDILVDRHHPTGLLVARECHSDGNYHIHAYLSFGRRRRIVDTTTFDVDGYHPNIQAVRSARAVLAYCRKDDPMPLEEGDLKEQSVARLGWGDLLEHATGRDNFLDLVRQSFPRDYVLRLEQLLLFCEWNFGRDQTTYSGRTRSEFRELPSMTEWVEANLGQVGKYITTNPNRRYACRLPSLTLTVGGAVQLIL